MPDAEALILFHTKITNLDRREACDLLETAIKKKEKFVYAAVKDVALTVRSLESESLKLFYNKCDYIFANGKGILYASWLLRKPLKEMVGGPGLYFEMLERASTKGYKVCLLGAKRPTLMRAMVNLKKRLPRINIVGYRDGYFDLENSHEIVEEMNRSEPDLVFLGMSTPKRELFVEKNRERFGRYLCIPVGDVFDIEAGGRRFAPRPISIFGLEWLYRVIQEPRRLFRRYFSTHLKFVWYFLKELTG